MYYNIIIWPVCYITADSSSVL
uniref:Uncharacterized protein n=1 Tax=Anguilla anguilla TaxID=7936 RepID=A0A0E9RW22_ANGAN